MESILQELIQIGKKMYEKQYIVATEGNLSCRIDQDQILTTASGACKGELSEDDLVFVDMDGRPVRGNRKPSTEIAMHLEVYRQREDVKAVVHAHPPYTLALVLSGVRLDQPFLPESALILGAVPVIPYARPSTMEVPESIRPFINKTDVMVLDRHGSLTVGKSLREAFYKLEFLEHDSKILWLARQSGPVSPMDTAETGELMKLREKVYGLASPIIPHKKKS